jgi:hypothetical protein
LIVVFALVLLAIPLIGQTETPIYAHLNYLKVAPGEADNFLRMVREFWMPIHEARLRAEIITGWQLYRVEYPSGTEAEYDYVAVNNFNDFNKTIDAFPAGVFQEAHPGADEQRTQEMVGEYLAMRDLVRREIWVRREALSSINPASYLLLTKMRVDPGGNDAYLTLERDIWKPIHQAVQDAGASAGWSVWQLFLPGGSREPYNFLTVSFYGDDQEVGRGVTDDLIREAHPSMTEAGWAATIDRTMDVREAVVREVWTRIEQVSAQ